VAVLGVGAVELPVPPVETVYHNKLEPVADNALAVSPTQYSIGLLTIGALGKVCIVNTTGEVSSGQTLLS